MTWSWFHRLGSPPHVYRLARRLTPWFAWPAAVLILVALYDGLVLAPPDYQQGDGYRIIYMHVPSAWMSLMVYTTMAVAAAVGLIWRMKVAHAVAGSCAPIGASFTFAALVTGSLWGEPMWGTWWEWDPRLTSELILLFLYLGYMGLHGAIEDTQRADRASAVLAVVGVVNVPIIHYSVTWWNSLHQAPSVLRLGRPTMPASMLVPLLLMLLGFTLFFVAVLLRPAARGDPYPRALRELDSRSDHDMSQFLDMGGYAVFVWPAYGDHPRRGRAERRMGPARARAGPRRGAPAAGWRGAGRMTPRQRRMTLVLGIVAGVSIAGALALSAFRENVTFFFDPTQVATGQVPAGERFRLGGMVQEGSLKRAPGSLEVRFVVTDFAHEVPVTYDKVLPDLFREGAGVVAHGRMRDGTFVADEVLAKHDEKYMPPAVARSLKRRHGESRAELAPAPVARAPSPAGS